MPICVILLILTFFNTITSKDLTPTHQMKFQYSQPPIPLNSYPYQEDLTSSVQFLREVTSNKKTKAGTLIKLLKKVLAKCVEVLKENDIKASYKSNTVEKGNIQGYKKDFVKENYTIPSEMKQFIIEELKIDNDIAKEVKYDNFNMEEIYEFVSKMVNNQKPQHNYQKLSNVDERTDTAFVPTEDFVENDPVQLHLRSQSSDNRYPYVSYVLEKPELKIIETYDNTLEKIVNIDQLEQSPKTSTKNDQELLKKQQFFIPCVKASDILDETPNYIHKGAYCEDNSQLNLNTDVAHVETTLENPVTTNYIKCSDSDVTVAMLFKPKTISLMQAYGNLLKKITVTVLVPFHVTKLVV